LLDALPPFSQTGLRLSPLIEAISAQSDLKGSGVAEAEIYDLIWPATDVEA
jgi:hypothetical protein